MITVLTYLWGTSYRAPHVQRLAQSVRQWLTVPHRFLCLTDHPVSGVETVANPAPEYPTRCYRRLWLFSEAAAQLGDRILHLDLDLVICGPLDALVRRSADLTIYRAGSIAARGYSLNPSVLWLRTGTQTDIWDRYRRHPREVAAAANADGFWGSDQAVISHLRKNMTVDTFGDEDGVVSFRRIRHESLAAPPPGTCIVSFHGKRTPFEKEIQQAHPWIRAAWGKAA
jgi:hypothetical protein